MFINDHVITILMDRKPMSKQLIDLTEYKFTIKTRFRQTRLDEFVEVG